MNVVAIPTRTRLDYLQPLVTALRQDWDVDLLLVLDNGHDAEGREWIYAQPPPVWPVACLGMSLHHMWNLAWDIAAREPGYLIKRQVPPVNLAFLNDDLVMPKGVIDRMATLLRQDNVAYVCHEAEQMAGHKWLRNTISGYCFMVRAEDTIRFDELFELYYGTIDLARRMEKRGDRIESFVDDRIIHHGGQTTMSVNATRILHNDRNKFNYTLRKNP